jgi:hypothetical protein
MDGKMPWWLTLTVVAIAEKKPDLRNAHHDKPQKMGE